MSVQNDQTAEYCTPADVNRYLQKPGGFDNTTTPTEAEVVSFIEKWSARVDRRTGRSWRENRVVEETHDHDHLYYWLSGHPIRLMKRDIRPIDASKGDKIEVYTGNRWEDWAADDTRQQGRDADYWLDAPVGILYVYEWAILRPRPKFRITYRYGGEQIPADIRDAVAARTAADLIQSGFFQGNVPGNNQASNADPEQAAETWEEQFHEIVSDYKKVRFI